VFLHAPEAEIVFLVVVEIIDMDDLDVIRLAVAVIIARGRIACARTEVKEKVWGTAAEIRRGDPPDPSTGFYLVLESSFAGETPVPWKECGGGGFQVVWRLVPSLSQAWQIQAFGITERQFKRNVEMRNERRGRILGGALAMTLSLGVGNLQAQEGRKVLSNPVPVYPEVARRLRLTGVVKVQVVIGADGRIKEKNVIGGHPILVSAVEDTLKNWKYAPASGETTTQLEFNFHP
jgi:TonB family protein